MHTKMDTKEYVLPKKRSMLYRKDESRIVRLFDPICTLEEIKAGWQTVRCLIRRGIPCVVSQDLVEMAGTYAVIYELPGVRTLGQVISEYPEDMELWAERTADFLHRIQQVTFEEGELEDVEKQLSHWQKRGEGIFSAEDCQKIRGLFDAIPKKNSLFLGNIHCGNILVQGDDLFLIDVDRAFIGNPVYELAGMFLNHEFARIKGDEYAREHMALTSLEAEWFYQEFQSAYLRGEKEHIEPELPKLLGLVLLLWGLVGNESIPPEIRSRIIGECELPR